MPSVLRAREAAGPARVHPLELRVRRVADRRDHAGQALAKLVERARLHRADRGASKRLARDVVADPRDVPLVRHRADQPRARALGDLGREAARVLGSADRRALRPDAREAPARGPPARVDVDRDADRRRAAPRGRLDQVEVRRLVDDQRRMSVGPLGGEAAPARRAPCDRRSGSRRRCPRDPGARGGAPRAG